MTRKVRSYPGEILQSRLNKSRYKTFLAEYNHMKPHIKQLFVTVAIIFVLTGVAVTVMDSLPASSLGQRLLPFIRLIFGLHMFCWMLLGMIANYLWDLFKKGKGLADIFLPNLLLPILVSPIVFFGIWSLWPESDSSKISFALSLVAFQNGFFWQVILSKAGPVAMPQV